MDSSTSSWAHGHGRVERGGGIPALTGGPRTRAAEAAQATAQPSSDCLHSCGPELRLAQFCQNLSTCVVKFGPFSAASAPIFASTPKLSFLSIFFYVVLCTNHWSELQFCIVLPNFGEWSSEILQNFAQRKHTSLVFRKKAEIITLERQKPRKHILPYLTILFQLFQRFSRMHLKRVAGGKKKKVNK